MGKPEQNTMDNLVRLLKEHDKFLANVSRNLKANEAQLKRMGYERLPDSINRYYYCGKT